MDTRRPLPPALRPLLPQRAARAPTIPTCLWRSSPVSLPNDRSIMFREHARAVSVIRDSCHCAQVSPIDAPAQRACCKTGLLPLRWYWSSLALKPNTCPTTRDAGLWCNSQIAAARGQSVHLHKNGILWGKNIRVELQWRLEVLQSSPVPLRMPKRKNPQHLDLDHASHDPRPTCSRQRQDQEHIPEKVTVTNEDYSSEHSGGEEPRKEPNQGQGSDIDDDDSSRDTGSSESIANIKV
uniref:Uncharacterized protein n=1 Tax=Knipowitschia caucasica TaxID=637954 RepID=A0AAV2JGD7_KNICA